MNAENHVGDRDRPVLERRLFEIEPRAAQRVFQRQPQRSVKLDHLAASVLDRDQHRIERIRGHRVRQRALLVALALQENPEALILCNGYKDRAFIETALLAQKLGRRVVITMDRMGELETILAAAADLDLRPLIGVRARLTTKGAGKWVESTGDRSKFGLTTAEIVATVERLRQAGKTLDYRAQEMFLARTGDDLRSVQQELEKLVLFIGDRSMITAQDVESVVVDQGEAWIFDLTRALGDRDAPAALAHLARLLAQGEAALKILATLTGEIRRLLRARQLLATDLAKLWRRGMSYQQFQQLVSRDRGPLLTRNLYADYMCFQRAERFSLAELQSYMEALFAADYRLKSGGTQAGLVLEGLVLGLCMRRRPAAALAARPVYR